MTKKLGFKGINSNKDNSKFELEISDKLDSHNYDEESGNVYTDDADNIDDTDNIVDGDLNEFKKSNRTIYEDSNDENVKPLINIDYWGLSKFIIYIILIMVFRYIDKKDKAKQKAYKSKYIEYQSPEYGERYKELMEWEKKQNEKYKKLLNYQNEAVQEFFHNSNKTKVYKFDYSKFKKPFNNDKKVNNFPNAIISKKNKEDLSAKGIAKNNEQK